eukprot:TRINITY_DN111482_c0_g1_i1.p1 TRINITY_DN111482_c0_g1~~TRINITY_DN111482_c0_g1_i1.p1  ORF type:complete len:286 (+),score=76.55 TRINITY_DN111482_c0_g1_i1:70-858(+)
MAANRVDEAYATLDVQPGISESDLKKVFRKLALRWHPDKNPDAKEEAKAMFVKVSAAYNVIMKDLERNPAARAAGRSKFSFSEHYDVTEEQFEEMRREKEEAEAHLESLRTGVRSCKACSKEDLDILADVWRRAYRNVEILTTQTADLEGRLNFKKSMLEAEQAREEALRKKAEAEAAAERQRLDAEAEETLYLEGPALLGETFLGFVDAIAELAWDGWAAACPRFFTSGYGQVGPKTQEQPADVPAPRAPDDGDTTESTTS